MTPYNESFVEIPAGKVALRTWGNEKDKPVIAVHGWLDNLGSFDRLAPLLKGVYLVSVDMLGHGHSDWRPKGVTYHFIDGVSDFFQIVQKLGWKKFSVLGHSLGGAIASIAAGTFPDQFEKMVLIESLGPLTEEAELLPERFAHHLQETELFVHKSPRLYPTVEDAAKIRQKNGNLSMQAALCLAKRGTREVSGGFEWRTDPRLRAASPQRLTESQVLQFLKRIACPTLVLRGSQGYSYDEKQMRERVLSLRNAKVETVVGNHHLHLENPQATADLIQPFL